MEAKVKKNPIIKKWLWLRYRMNVIHTYVHRFICKKKFTYRPYCFNILCEGNFNVKTSNIFPILTLAM